MRLGLLRRWLEPLLEEDLEQEKLNKILMVQLVFLLLGRWMSLVLCFRHFLVL